MDFKKIIEEYPYKTELHSHTTPASSCGKFRGSESVKIYLDAKVNTLTITNHLKAEHLKNRTLTETVDFYLADYYEAKKAAEGTGLEVAFGVEIRFDNDANDYLVYGIAPEDVERIATYVPKDIHTFYREFKNDKNIILHAHPFRNGMDPTPFGSVDGIETFNTHPGHNGRIALASKLAREHDFIVSGGSDFHEEGRHATCLTRTRSLIRDSYDIAEALKSRDIVFDVYGSIVVPYLY